MPLGLSGYGLWFYLVRAGGNPALLASVYLYPLLDAVPEFPISAICLLPMGFSAPCLPGNFLTGTVRKRL